MRRARWSRLYPRVWREEFGEEFDALIASRGMGFGDVVDVTFHAASAWMGIFARLAPAVIGWGLIAWLNLFAKEVQWTAGALLLICVVAAVRRQSGWPLRTIGFALAVPVSTLVLYQRPGGYHAPLYQTAVAVFPALAGSLIGLGIAHGARPEPA